MTFSKRRYGIFKKAYELSVLCGCEIGIVMLSPNGKLFQYASSNLESLLLKYTECGEAAESKTNFDIEKLIEREKEFRGDLTLLNSDLIYTNSSGDESLPSPSSFNL